MIDFEKFDRDVGDSLNPPVEQIKAPEEEQSGAIVESVRELPPIVDSFEFSAAEIPEPPQLVKGVIHKGTKIMIGGGSKSFKTWIQLDLAVSIAYGLPWLGFETVPGRVLFTNMEVPDWAFQDRLQKIMEAKKIIPVPGRLDIWNLRGFSTSYKEMIPQIIERIKTSDYAAVDLDPLYKIYGDTDENDASQVGQLFNSLERICVEAKSSVLCGAHYSKGNQSGKESIDRVSGSGVFAREPDSIINFTKLETEDCYAVEMNLRNLPPIKPFSVRWQYPLMVRDDELDPTELKQVGRSPKFEPADAYDLLPDSGLTATEWEEKAVSAGISRTVFYRLKKQLASGGAVMVSKLDNLWKPVREKGHYS